MIGLLAEIGFAALVETFPYWSFSGRRRYRAYVRALPPGETPLSRREWRAAERADPSGESS